MQIEATNKGKWKLISISGRFDAQNAQKVDAEVKSLIEQGNKYIAIDLTEINYMSSAGLRILLSNRKLTKEKGGSLVLVNPQENVMEVLELSGFSNIFFIMNSIEGLL